jgi:hypothetical protein
MPRLLAFLPCEQVIIGKDSSVSLITVMQTVDATIPASIRGENVLLPIKWALFSFWMKEDGDDGVEFEQRVEVFSADGEPLLSQDSTFVIDKITHSQIGRVLGLPVAGLQAGPIQYRFRLSIRIAGDSGDFQPVSEYPFGLRVTLAAEPSVKQ